jgi:hypothetical protein
MPRKIYALALIYLVSGCTSLPIVTVGLANYPNPSYEEREGVKKMLASANLPTDQYQAAYALAKDVDLAKPMSIDDIDNYNKLVQEFHRRERAEFAARNEREAKEKREREELIAAEEASRKERAALQESERKKAQYQYAYKEIQSPDDAKSFIDQYAGKYDPENLAATAMKKGYAAGIEQARQCMDWANKTIQNQNEIGRQVGYVNKSAIYEAGARLVYCRKELARYKLEAAKLR